MIQPACTIGIDYALAAPHVLSVRWTGEAPEAPRSVPANRPAIRSAIGEILKRAQGAPVRVAFEGSGRQLHGLLETIDGLVLYPINPAASQLSRRALHISGAKSDELDAAALRTFLESNVERLRPAVTLDPASADLGALCEDRRALVDLRKADGNRMIDFIRHDLPALAAAFGGYSKLFAKLLVAHPDLHALARKRRPTLEGWLRKNGRLGEKKRVAVLDALASIDPTAKGLRWRRAVAEAHCTLLREEQISAYEKEIKVLYAAHPLHDFVDSLPGSGPALGPRLCAFIGADLDRWPEAMDMLLRSGVAPVERKSGKAPPLITRRLACRKFDLQTFVEFARCSAKSSTWAHNFVETKRRNKKSAHSAYRALAFKWIRIIHACLKSGTTYDESKLKSPYARANSTAEEPVEKHMKRCEIEKSKP